MKPSQGRIVDYFRSISHDAHLDTFPALIITAELKPPRLDLENHLVPRDPEDERSYDVRVHVFGRTDDAKLDAVYSSTPAAGCWSWPKYVRELRAIDAAEPPMVRPLPDNTIPFDNGEPPDIA